MAKGEYIHSACGLLVVHLIMLTALQECHGVKGGEKCSMSRMEAFQILEAGLNNKAEPKGTEATTSLSCGLCEENNLAKGIVDASVQAIVYDGSG